MKVIKDNSKKRIICTKCDSVLEYDINDINSERRINGRQYVICPICNTSLDIKDSTIVKDTSDSNNESDKKIDLKKDAYGDLIDIPNGCPKCGHDLHKLMITDCKIYSCFDCGYEVEYKEK